MKKLVLSFILCHLAFSYAVAQSFQFKYQGTPVADNAVVTIAAAADAYGFGELWCETNPSSHPRDGLVVELLGASTADGLATLTIDYNTLRAATVKWCMGGACSLMNETDRLQKSFTVTDGVVPVEFSAENLGSEGYLLATLTVTIGGETHRVVVQFTNGQSASVHSPSQRLDTARSYHDLAGRPILHRPAGGLYIADGRKVVVR
jgi:hypothetical protein